MFKRLTYLVIFAVALGAAYYYRVTNPQQPTFGNGESVFVEAVQSRVFSIVGRVDPYSRGGLVERYGARVQARHGSPVSSDHLQIYPYKDAVVLAYSNFDFPDREADSIRLALAKGQEKSLVSAGVRFKSGRTLRFDKNDNGLAENFFEDIPSLQSSRVKEITNAGEVHNFANRGDGSVLGQADDVFNLSEIEFAFAVFDTSGLNNEVSAKTGVRLNEWSFLKEARADQEQLCKINGKRDLSGVVAPEFLVPETVYLLTEDGKRMAAHTSSGGEFEFKEIDCEQAIKVVAKSDRFNMEFYADDGRWFWASEPEEAYIHIYDPYADAQEDHLVPKKKDWGFEVVRFPSPDYRIGPGKPHTLQYHPGVPGRVQYWDQNSFVNYHGFWDRDRFAQNADSCLRVLIVGGSNITSVHMITSRKFNILAEEEASILLGRCVEIITAGQGSGHIGEYYEFVRDYGKIVQPDLVLVETSTFQLLPIDMDFAEWMYGIDREHNRWRHFVRDDQGQIKHLDRDRAYTKYLKDRREDSFYGCVPLKHSASVPFPVMDQKVAKIWDFYEDVLKYVEGQTRLEVGIVGFNQATIGARTRSSGEEYCVRPDGRVDFYGEAQFGRNLEQFCEDSKRPCFLARTPLITSNKPEMWLTWPNDMHMSWRGHQYIGHELARTLYEHFGREMAIAKTQSPQERYLEFATPAPKDEFEFETDVDGNIKLVRKVNIAALEQLIVLPKDERADFLDKLEDRYFRGYRHFLQKVAGESDYSFCSMEDEGMGCWHEPRRIVLRYDVHVNDLLPAFVLAKIHDELRIPAVFYTMDVNTPVYLEFLRYYDALSEHRSKYVRFGPHPSAVCSYITFVMDNSPEKDACNNDAFKEKLFSQISADGGEELAQQIREGAVQFWSSTRYVHESLFGSAKSLALHGSPYNKTAQAKFLSDPEMAEKYPWLSPTGFVKHEISKEGYLEHTLLSKETDGGVFVSEGEDPRIDLRILAEMEQGRKLGILIHPYSFLNGRVDFHEYDSTFGSN